MGRRLMCFVGVDAHIDPSAFSVQWTKKTPPGWAAFETVKKTSQKMSGTEQRGVCAGGKKPTARSITRILKLF